MFHEIVNDIFSSAVRTPENKPDFVDSAKPQVERVLFNKPATVVFWSDGTKTVAKCNECSKWRRAFGEVSCKDAVSCGFSKHVGLAVACARKAVPDLAKHMRGLDE